LEVRLSEEEINNRLQALAPFEQSTTSSWLRRYSRVVSSANRGAVLI
jgi:dihydroxy-acid dehydratase